MLVLCLVWDLLHGLLEVLKHRCAGWSEGEVEGNEEGADHRHSFNNYYRVIVPPPGLMMLILAILGLMRIRGSWVQES